MSRLNQMVIALFAISLCIAPAGAKEFYVGEPVVKNEMQIVPHYLLGIEMSAMPKGKDMSHDAVHLEVMFTPLKTKSTAWPMASGFPTLPSPIRSKRLAPVSSGPVRCCR